jgi:hypothetical protein
MIELLKSDPAPEPPLGAEPDAAPDVEQAARTASDRVVLCAVCRAAIARTRDRIEVDGAHVHTFVNPSVVPYRIACYAEAPGTVGVGDESTFWAWFKGFAWRVAVCAQCLAHVGWSFRSVDRAFFGLIVERIVEA